MALASRGIRVNLMISKGPWFIPSMKVINLLPALKSFLEKHEDKPSREAFEREYLSQVSVWIQPMLDDFFQFQGSRFYDEIEDLDWKAYRDETLPIDPSREEQRVRRHIESVEKLLGQPLRGEVVLLGAFTLMDGYARFDRGEHRVYLGVDESHGRGAYLDVLITHELTHVIREGTASVWSGFGLNPKMTHDEFGENQPVIEHLFSEGFSCVVSELLNPSSDPWSYVYQTEASLKSIYLNSHCVDREIHQELSSHQGYYRDLYNPDRYGPNFPMFSHYVWAWQWVKHLLETQAGGDVRKLIPICSKNWVGDAVGFRLKK